MTTFNEVVNEALDKAEAAQKAFGSLKPEEKTPAAVNAFCKAMKDASLPIQQFVRIQKIRAKAARLIAWPEGEIKA